MDTYKYKAIIFDFDGVLVDSVHIKALAFAKLYESHGDDVVNKVVQFHEKNGGVTRDQKFKHYHKNYLGKTLSDGELDELCQHFSCIVEDEVTKAPWINGAKSFLEKNYKKFKLFIASATPQDELIRIVKNRSMNSFFHNIYCAPKSKIQNIAKIISENNYDRTEIIMIGDAVSDYQGAIANGIDFIGIGEDERLFPQSKVVLPDLGRIQEYVGCSTIEHA